MKKNLSMLALAALAVMAMALPVLAVDPHLTLLNDASGPAGAPPQHPVCTTYIQQNVNTLGGGVANYKWYNICNKYIWCYTGWLAGDGVGSLYGGGSQPAVAPGNAVSRVTWNFRVVVPNYGNLVDVFVDQDNGDGSPDGVLSSAIGIDPAERWNCFDFGTSACIPGNYVITRAVHYGGSAPRFCTDGGPNGALPHCNPAGSGAHSYYYPPSGPPIVWPGILTPNDNFLNAIAIDQGSNCPSATEDATWGKVKGLYQ
jgi:hypothetical protein